ncbi:hypothetical protein IV203_026117 [Nitzschia inconspicua]|uniref:Uncharacterized protein n=1 Tax=Nitzschia inconspicua TaxID=303405 RepID=A0A9K3PWV4_9STRA|nr:hypothetical protein IV203_026117 [Nitzschia inconspicua]
MPAPHLVLSRPVIEDSPDSSTPVGAIQLVDYTSTSFEVPGIKLATESDAGTGMESCLPDGLSRAQDPILEYEDNCFEEKFSSLGVVFKTAEVAINEYQESKFGKKIANMVPTTGSDSKSDSEEEIIIIGTNKEEEVKQDEEEDATRSMIQIPEQQQQQEQQEEEQQPKVDETSMNTVTFFGTCPDHHTTDKDDPYEMKEQAGMQSWGIFSGSPLPPKITSWKSHQCNG